MNIQASEISKILKEQIKNFGDDTEVAGLGKFCLLEMELHVYMVLIKFKLVRWLSSLAAQWEWRLTSVSYTHLRAHET